ncbi:hypothetical protein D3C72_997610 [compost metagenome]
MVLRLKCFLLLLPLLGLSLAAQGAAFEKKTATLGKIKIKIEVAETPQQHAQGLMFREKMGSDEGMLFIFSGEEPRSFWMKNTLMDLSIGFFTKDRILIDIQEMKSGKGVPDTMLASYVSAKPAKYALEMNKGWFDKMKVKLGTVLKVNP